MCQSLGFTVTNNHALRMALNSNVFIPLGIPVTERARMLGHSVETNLRKYSFAGKNSNGNILEVLNGYHPIGRFLMGHVAEDGTWSPLRSGRRNALRLITCVHILSSAQKP